MRARALETQMEAQLPGVDVTVFGRIRGFEAALADRPEAILAQRPVLEALGLRPVLQGYNGSSPDEPYFVVSSKAPLLPEQLTNKDVGAVNILGRHHMDAFVQQLLGGATPRLKYVTHERDLLALLQFGAAEAVITSGSWVERFKQKSQMTIHARQAKGNVGLAAVAFPTGSGGIVEERIKSAGNDFNQALGVTKWR